MAALFKGLNSAQRTAVTSPAHVLQILAPPGSGKTKTLTSRVAYLINQHQFDPQNVICCTFTIKAAREMRERLRSLVGPQLEAKLILGTFHSICRRYLVRYGHLIEIPPNFGIADEDDRKAILKRLVKENNLSIDAQVAKSRISYRKAQGRRLQDFKKAAQKTVEERDFVTLYIEYEASLAKSNLLDYDDLLLRCIDLLTAYPHCVRNVEAVLIDEFQDTNVVQFELMQLFAQAHNHITIVGDPDQSIYGFRAAQIENLHKMRNVYPDTVVINLEENYRSSAAILRFAQEIIEQDSARSDKKLSATHCYGTMPVLRKLPNPHEEALWIVAEIKRTLAATGSLLNYSDFAILLRSAALSLRIEKALTSQGIPYRMVGGFKFFARREVRLVVNYLRTLHSPDNDSALLAVLNVPSRKLGDKSVEAIRNLAARNGMSAWAAIQKVVRGSLQLEKNLSRQAERNLQDFVNVIDGARKVMLSAMPDETPRLMIEHIVLKLNLKQYLKDEYKEDHEDRWENIQELANQATDVVEIRRLAEQDSLPEIEGVEQRQVNSSTDVLGQFLATIVLSSEVESSEEEKLQPRVTVSTMHSAKGLEWPVVFIPAAYEGSIPHSRAEDTDEERRVFYVAITRAQVLLSLSFPLMQSNDMGESILSQFLPTEVHPKCSSIGSNFSDRVVEDMAAILRRRMPSQEEIVKSMRTLTDSESISDDLWPSDGSRRRLQTWSEEDPTQMRSLLSSGSFSFTSTGLPRSGQGFRHQSPSTEVVVDGLRPSSFARPSLTNNGAPTIPTGKASFTTASVHYEQHKVVEADVTKHEQDLMTAQPSKKARKAVDASQGSLANWFAKGNFRASAATGVTPTQDAILPTSLLPRQPLLPLLEAFSLPEIHSASSIQSIFDSHRLPLDKTTLLPTFRKRPAQPLTESPPSKKNVYVFLSSSPPRPADEDEPESNHTNDDLDENHVQVNAPLLENNCSINFTSHSSTSQWKSTSSFKPATTLHKTSLAQLKPQAGQATTRKTLGVRRAMNGWDARKFR